MNEREVVTQNEWLLISVFLALLLSLGAIAYLSDAKLDKEVERYLRHSEVSKHLRNEESL